MGRHSPQVRGLCSQQPEVVESGLCLLPQGQIQGAERRVVMASLYLGTGPREQELVGSSQGWGTSGLGLSQALEISASQHHTPHRIS